MGSYIQRADKAAHEVTLTKKNISAPLFAELGPIKHLINVCAVINDLSVHCCCLLYRILSEAPRQMQSSNQCFRSFTVCIM